VSEARASGPKVSARAIAAGRSTSSVQDAGGPGELRTEVAKLAAGTAARGERQFSGGKGRTSAGKPFIAMLDLRLKRLDHMQHEWHVAVTIPYAAATDDGMPDGEELEAVRALEDELRTAIGDGALYYGHVIEGGRLRVLFYTKDRDATARAVAGWIGRHPDRKIGAEWRQDPEWKEYRQF
jgi:hypothetical protein